MPSLGLFRETLQGMHLNRARWEDNHLTDLMHLTCAAGYADYVVGERSHPFPEVAIEVVKFRGDSGEVAWHLLRLSQNVADRETWWGE